MSKRETVTEYGGTVFSEKDGELIIEMVDGSHEVWFQNDGHASFGLTYKGHDYEFASGYQTHRAVKNLIGAVWTLLYRKVSATEIEVLRYTRDDAEGYKNEKSYPLLNTQESSDGFRTLHGVWIQPRETAKADAYWAEAGPTTPFFFVTNQKSLFMYK